MIPECNIWMEGFAATGESSPAQLVGTVFGAEDFRDACDRIMALKNKEEGWETGRFYDRGRLTYWGCRLFDNEADARKSFG